MANEATAEQKSVEANVADATANDSIEQVANGNDNAATNAVDSVREADENDEHEIYEGRDKAKKHNRTDRGANRPPLDKNRGGNRGGRGGRARGRGGVFLNSARKNIKTQFERQPESDDPIEICRQLEFYMSDSNLSIDRFLLDLTGGSENKPVPLKTFHDFKRMRHFKPFSALVGAIEYSHELEINDKNEIFRKHPLPGHFTMSVDENQAILDAESMKRSIYAKGFGPEGEKTMFEIEDFFRPYGFRSVRARRYHDKTFKGSVFVEFVDEETAKSFLGLKSKPQFKGNEMIYKSKQDYIDEKMESVRKGEVQPHKPSGQDIKRGRARADVDGIHPDDWRARRDRDNAQKRYKGKFAQDKEPEADGKGASLDHGNAEADDDAAQADSKAEAAAAAADAEAKEEEAAES